ncbi:DUF445 family protein [Anaerobacillus alkaliphilus]|uniref:DUF445 family protein n=1 Tax=Anaerobacillus alkaliphilus TaxID=1548597 RepID=A0A4Q0VST3_9BACI|nr:DUF445 family protein [Anaerobacillus alkaliphilus]RXI99872.1 DUF445 family protein [Anaerobacillus alkaliphilus]
MNVVVVVIMMVLVGALIGGVTNSLAIKMLFRPYRAYFIGKWRVPFTPGLIPKRRGELAEQLGKLVVNHLLTAEGLQKKLQDKLFLNEITEWVQREVTKLVSSEETLVNVLEKWFGITNGKEKARAGLERWLNKKLNVMVEEIRPLQLEEVVPKGVNEAVDKYIPQLTHLILEKVKNYFNSPEGIDQLANMVDRFLLAKGTFGNMITMFLGNERLVDKIQPEIIKMLNDEGTHQLIEDFLTKEWRKVKKLRVTDLEEYMDVNEVMSFLQEKIMDHVPFTKLDKPLKEWSLIIEQPLINEVVPLAVNKVGQAVSSELVTLLTKLKLEDVVREQVEQFSVSRLEDMVLSISRRELKLITYLGALLGGLIGLFQGIFIIFLS